MDSDKRQMIQAARSTAIDYLSYGAKTSGKIILKLKDKGFDNETIKQVLQELREESYIKDDAIMEAYWLRRSGSRRESIDFFCRRMSNLGVNKVFIEEFKRRRPSEHFDPLLVSEYLNAKFVHELNDLREDRLNEFEKKRIIQKIIRNCASHGFHYGLVLDGLRACAILIQE